MAGQIISRGERTWLVRVFLGRDSRTGKRRYHNHTIRGNRKDAQKYLNGVLREIDLGTFIEPSTMTLDEYLDQWLVTAKMRVREETYFGYEASLRRYVRPALGSKKIGELNPLELQALYTEMLGKGLSARTVRYTHTILSSALKQAVKWGLLVRNPASLVELPRQSRKEMLCLSPEEAERFLNAAAEDRFGVLFAFALATGMRPEEYFGLQWKDVDLQSGIVTVQRTLVWRTQGSGWYFSEPKTPRSRRSIPLPRSILNSLIEHKRRQAEERLRAGPKYKNLDLVFATRKGGPLLRHHLWRLHFKPILRRAGLNEALRLYDLRHSCATLLLAANENPKVVSERLGHANISLTLDTYSHVLPSMQQAASEKLENLVFAKVAHNRHTR